MLLRQLASLIVRRWLGRPSQPRHMAMLRRATQVVAVFAFLAVLLTPTFGDAQAPTPAPTGIAPVVETLFAEGMQASSAAYNAAPPLSSLLDSVVSNTFATMEGAAAETAGAAAVGNPLTWAALAAAAAGGAAYCLTEGCDVNAAMLSQIINNMTNSGSAAPATQPGQQLYDCNGSYNAGGGNVTTATLVGASPTAVVQQCLEFSQYANTTYSGCQVTKQVSATTVQVTCNEVWNSNQGPVTSTVNSDAFETSNYTVPNGGLSCGSGSLGVFDVQSLGSGTLSCNESMNSNGQVGPGPTPTIANVTASNFTPAQLAEPVNPQVIANLANLVAQEIAGGGGGSAASGGGSSNSPNLQQAAQQWKPETPQAAETVMAQTNNWPTLADLFAPVAPNALITTGSSPGTYTVSNTTVVNSNGTIAPYMPAPKSSNGNLLCGNAVAGEPDCSVTLDFVYNPATDTWEWNNIMPGQNVGPVSGASTQLANIQQSTTELLQYGPLAPGTALQTGTGISPTAGLSSGVNPLTDPLTQSQTLTQSMPQSIAKTPDTLQSPTPPVPPIVLPFNEWPAVMQAFNTDVPDMGAGKCPTVSVYSVILKTTITFDGQCIVMDALQPYMAYVLPPTYLLMALFFIMSA